MPTLFTRAATCVLGFFLFTPAAMSAFPPEDPYRFLIQQTGIAQQLPSLKESIVQRARQHSRRCASESLAKIDSHPAMAAFHSNALSEQLRTLLQQSIGMTRLASVLQWYSSAAGQRIRWLESLPVLDDEYTAFAQSLASDSNWTNVRKELVQQINKNIHADEFATIVGTEIEYAALLLSACIEQESLHSNGINHEQLRADLTRKDRNLLMDIFHTETNIGIGFQLRWLTDSELREYASFTSTEKAQTFYRRLIDSLDKSLQSASNSLAH